MVFFYNQTKSIKIMSNIIIPSNPADQTKLKGMISEAVLCKARIDAENETKKEIIETISEDFEIPKKLINNVVNTQHKLNYSEKSVESSDFELLYETLYEASEVLNED